VNSQSNARVSKTGMDLDVTWNIAMSTFMTCRYHKDLPYEGCITLLPFRSKISKTHILRVWIGFFKHLAKYQTCLLLPISLLLVVKTTNDKRKCCKKRKETPKDESYTEVNNYKKNEMSFYKKTTLTYGKDVTMSSRMQVREWVSSFSTAHQHSAHYSLGSYSVP